MPSVSSVTASCRARISSGGAGCFSQSRQRFFARPRARNREQLEQRAMPEKVEVVGETDADRPETDRRARPLPTQRSSMRARPRS